MRRPPGPVSLRGRLTIGIMALLTCGLLAGDVTAALAVHAFLQDRVDRNLAVVAGRATEAAGRSSGQPVTDDTIDRLVPADVYVAFFDPRGRQVLERGPSEPTGATGFNARAVGVVPSTVAGGGPGGVRAVAVELPVQAPLQLTRGAASYDVTRLVVGISRRDDAATERRLLRVELASGLLILLVMALASRAVLRSGLAPLRTMADTADDIGRGNLSRRVEVPDASTEIGAVAVALNSAFAQRERSEQQVRTFVADASHELRTPLSTVHGWADLYASGGIDDWEGVDTAMSNIRTESQRMGSLVDQLLTLARLDAHEPLHPTPVDLTALCAQTIADLQLVHATHPVTLDAPGPVLVRADEPTLRQVLDNLLTNAVRHTPEGTPIEVLISRPGLDQVALDVVDHGPGLDQIEMDQAFDRFWRAHRRPLTEGTGLGLSIARQLVLANSGQIALHHTPGGGLTVAIGLLTG